MYIPHPSFSAFDQCNPNVIQISGLSGLSFACATPFVEPLPLLLLLNLIFMVLTGTNFSFSAPGQILPHSSFLSLSKSDASHISPETSEGHTAARRTAPFPFSSLRERDRSPRESLNKAPSAPPAQPLQHQPSQQVNLLLPSPPPVASGTHSGVGTSEGSECAGESATTEFQELAPEDQLAPEEDALPLPPCDR